VTDGALFKNHWNQFLIDPKCDTKSSRTQGPYSATPIRLLCRYLYVYKQAKKLFEGKPTKSSRCTTERAATANARKCPFLAAGAKIKNLRNIKYDNYLLHKNLHHW